jgi:hypothetical protein
MKTRTPFIPSCWIETTPSLPLLLAAGLVLLAPLTSRAQWQSQTITLKPGWNAVFLHVDPSYDTLLNQVGTNSSIPIKEVWLWQPSLTTAQFIQNPQTPASGNSQWAAWDRGLGGSSPLQRLVGNAAYLVRNTNSVDYVWTVKGKPVPPRYVWTTTGLNFLGFPTPTNNTPDFDKFLTPAPEFQRNAEIYYYPGGELGATNPMRLFALHTTPVTRGQAYWMRAGDTYNRYYGPFEVSLQNADGVQLGDSASQYRFRLRNLTTGDLKVNLQLITSETPPAGQSNIVAAPPLLLRGALNLTNLSYGYTNLVGAAAQSWVLKPQGQPDSDIEVVLGLNRSAMTAAAGSLYAGIVRLTDTNSLSQVDIPVSATVASNAGLWVGGATVKQVRSYLKSFQRDGEGEPVVNLTATNGPYVVIGINTNLGATARNFPLRLIVHNNATNNAVMLQRVFYGLRQGTNVTLATKESILDSAQLASARRISSAHLPFSSGNIPWNCTGKLQLGTNITTTISLNYDDQVSNPFLHTYHPDHDNLDAAFGTVQPQGFESYRVDRQITLNVTLPLNDFVSLTTGSQNLVGVYQETLTFYGKTGESRQFDVLGTFSLNRISNIATLTTQ